MARLRARSAIAVGPSGGSVASLRPPPAFVVAALAPAPDAIDADVFSIPLVEVARVPAGLDRPRPAHAAVWIALLVQVELGRVHAHRTRGSREATRAQQRPYHGSSRSPSSTRRPVPRRAHWIVERRNARAMGGRSRLRRISRTTATNAYAAENARRTEGLGKGNCAANRTSNAIDSQSASLRSTSTANPRTVCAAVRMNSSVCRASRASPDAGPPPIMNATGKLPTSSVH